MARSRRNFACATTKTGNGRELSLACAAAPTGNEAAFPQAVKCQRIGSADLFYPDISTVAKQHVTERRI